MLGTHHKEITSSALLGYSPLDYKAIQIIGLANADSDSTGRKGCYSYAVQHFSTKKVGGSEEALRNSFRFVHHAIHNAGVCVDRGWFAFCVERRWDQLPHHERKRVRKWKAADYFEEALYFFGRACHCMQDFYAHSNWVAWGNNDIWKGQWGESIRLCLPSTLWNAGFNFYPWNLSIRKKKTWLKRMKNRERPHPDIHLDYPGCWASGIIKDTNAAGGQTGYQRARSLAIKHTKQLWDNFQRGHLGKRIKSYPRKRQDKLLVAFYTHRPKKLTLARWGTEFNKAMGI